MIRKLVQCIWLCLYFGSSGVQSSEADSEYWADVSFPILSRKVSTNYPWLPHNVDPENNPVPEEYKDMPIQPLGDRQKFYDDFMEACREHYHFAPGSCDETEETRIAMSVRQPQSMMNYTTLGFKKVQAPEKLKKLLFEFWENNQNNRKDEQWPIGYTYTNHWSSPTYMVSVEDTDLPGAGQYLKSKIWEAARETIEGWTGMELAPISLYGIRVYTEGSILSPHADRLPLVSSAIINVAQDVDEDWPLEVYGHDGRVYNVTMQPGDMVLYESHSLIHGRPFSLKGRYYANIFIHFEPTGRPLSQNIPPVHNDMLPPYVRKNSPEEDNWKMQNPGGWNAPAISTNALPEAHLAAAMGDTETLSDIAHAERDLLHWKDQNGWQPIHEAARGGHKSVVELLVGYGVNVNERTGYGKGGTALYWADVSLGADHPVVKYLRSIGGVNIGPEL